MNRVKMIINNLRHRGASKYDIVVEINHREQNIMPNEEKFFGYTTEELETALKYWNEY